MHYHETGDMGTGKGAGIGALVGGVLGLLGGPIGLAVGAGIGAAARRGGLRALTAGFRNESLNTVGVALKPEPLPSWRSRATPSSGRSRSRCRSTRSGRR